MDKQRLKEIQDEIFREQEKLKQPLSGDEMETILRRIIDLLNERKAVCNE